MNALQINSSKPAISEKARSAEREPSRYAAAVVKAFRLIRGGKANLLFAVPLYRMWWRLRGLDFGYVSVEELGLAADRSNQHMDGGGPLLCDLLRQLRISPRDAALDIGSGKGGAMAALARFPFHIVDGVEISSELADAAKLNLARLKVPNCRIFVADATTFTDLDEYTHIFMYNPFPEAVVRIVMANIVESLRRAPRKLRLIYSNPLCEGAILAAGHFKKFLVYEPYPEYRITVYESDPRLGSLTSAR